MSDNKLAYAKSFVVVYLSSASTMIAMFVYTMMVIYQEFDAEYLLDALIVIGVLSLVSGFASYIIYKRKIVIKILFGIFTGPLSGAIYIFIKSQGISS